MNVTGIAGIMADGELMLVPRSDLVELLEHIGRKRWAERVRGWNQSGSLPLYHSDSRTMICGLGRCSPIGHGGEA